MSSPEHVRRLRGDRGTGLVAAVTLMFAFTAGAVVWLAGDADRALSNRSTAQSIAFQAARSAAQQIQVDALRDGTIVIDERLGAAAAGATAARLFAAYDVDGAVTGVVIEPARATVTITISDSRTDRTVTGTGIVRVTDQP